MAWITPDIGSNQVGIPWYCRSYRNLIGEIGVSKAVRGVAETYSDEKNDLIDVKSCQ